MSYTPKGKVVLLLQVIESEPFREFTSKEAAAIMDCDQRAVAASLHYPARNRLVFLRKEGRNIRIRGTAYSDQERQDAARRSTDKAIRSRRSEAASWATDANDIRIPQVVPGWAPPRMVAPRG